MSSTDAATLEKEISGIEDTKKLHTASDPGEFKGKEGTHVPKVEFKDGKAKIEIPHEMKPEHWIQYIWAKNEGGTVLGACKLTHSDVPVLHIEVPEGVKSITAYECCNLHGMWKSEPQTAP